MDQLSHLLQEDERPFLPGMAVEVEHPEDLTLELQHVPVFGDMSHDLPHLNPLSFDVVGVDGNHHITDHDGTSIFHRVIDGEPCEVPLKLVRVGLPLIADQDGSRKDVGLDERDQDIGVSPDGQHEGRPSLSIISPFDEAHNPDRFGSEHISAVVLPLVEMALVDLHDHPWSAEHQIAVLPCSAECCLNNVEEDVPVMEPGPLRDASHRLDGAGRVPVAPSLQRCQELSDVADIPEVAACDDVDGLVARTTAQ